MMKLILSVTLLWMLSSSAEALQCLRSNGSSTDRHTCSSKDELCATLAVQDLTKKDEPVTHRSCMPSSVCSVHGHIFSFSVSSGTMAVSVQCCDTDGCNDSGKGTPLPDLQKPNGLQCYSCNDGIGCHEIVQCVGNQDRCINANVTVRGNIHPFRGCVSTSMCELFTQQKVRTGLAEHFNFTSEPTCCGSSLCNSAWTVRLSVGPLLLGLVALIVF